MDEFPSHESALQELATQVGGLCQYCTQPEASGLNERLTKLKETFTERNNLIEKRIALCGEWLDFSEARDSIQTQSKNLQQRMESPDLSQADLDSIHTDMEEIRSVANQWNQKQEQLEQNMIDCHMTIKDRATQRTVYFNTELQTLTTVVVRTTTQLEQRRGKLDEITSLWQNFNMQKDALTSSVTGLKDKLQSTKIQECSLEGAKTFSNDVEGIRQELESHAPQFEDFRDLGRQLMTADESHAGKIQTGLSTVETQWDSVHSLIQERQQHIALVLTQWEQYSETRVTVVKVLTSLEPTLHGDLSFDNATAVRDTLDKYKVSVKQKAKCTRHYLRLGYTIQVGVQLNLLWGEECQFSESKGLLMRFVFSYSTPILLS